MVDKLIINLFIQVFVIVYLAASIPSQVDDNFMRILSLEIPACLYRSISFLALAMDPSLSKDNLEGGKINHVNLFSFCKLGFLCMKFLYEVYKTSTNKTKGK